MTRPQELEQEGGPGQAGASDQGRQNEPNAHQKDDQRICVGVGKDTI